MNNSKKISLGAMITVLSIILLYTTSVIPTARIFLISLTSFLIAVLIIDAGIKVAILSFISTSILGFLLVPNKILLVPYVTFLGYYGIIKSSIESINNLALEWIIKIVVFNIAACLNYLLISKLIGTVIALPFSIWLVVLALQVLFITYDYMFSLFIAYYTTQLKKYIR